MKHLIVFACLCALALGILIKHEEEELFANWMQQHNKVYTNDQYITRFQNFQASLARIKELNAKSDGAVYGLNQFADMSEEEFQQTVLMEPQETFNPDEIEVLWEPSPDAPATYDWRDHGAVTAVKNQASCGSCWAFSATEAIESAWIIGGHATANNLNLSPQQIVDCDKTDAGCNGGWPDKAMTYVHNAGGQEGIAHYPYTAKNGACNFVSSYVEAKVQGFTTATKQGDETTMQNNLISMGPLSICLDASQWQHYTSGVMTNTQCCTGTCKLDHCVQLVGYNSTGNSYWIARNSWAATWGIHGYIYLQMGHNTCGLTNHVTWPRV